MIVYGETTLFGFGFKTVELCVLKIEWTIEHLLEMDFDISVRQLWLPTHYSASQTKLDEMTSILVLTIAILCVTH